MSTNSLDRKPLVARRLIFALGVSLIAACGGGGGSTPATAVASGLQTSLNGFSFPNFPSESYPDQFEAPDLVSMFGGGNGVCVGGTADPCTLTAEAAAFARLVNQSRASGHCEGLVTLAMTRFNAKQDPDTVQLPAEGETIHAVMRAFATQFIPEVQTEVMAWLSKSLEDKISALTKSIASGKLEYTLGVYTEQGGHAILPYAIEYPTPGIARIMVYDSNWPAKNRYVDVDLKKKTWTFSFSGEDPANDPDVWTGGANRMDLTALKTREGSCPFCGDGSTVKKTTLLVRTENLNWSVDVNGTKVSPQTPDAASADGVVVKPVKGASNRGAYDYVIEIPTEAISDKTTTTVKGTTQRSKLSFSGSTSVFAVTSSGIAQVKTPGNANIPVEIGPNSIVSKDPNVNLTLASGNLVATASGPSASLEVTGSTMAVTVEAANGQIVTQSVTPDAPSAQIVADAKSGGVTVLAQSASGEVTKRDVSADGTETKSVSTAPLNLNSTSFEAPPGLESKAIASLPSLEKRNLANPEYKADAAYVAPTTTVKDGKVDSQAVAQVKPTFSKWSLDSKVFGDASFTLTEPTSNSDGSFIYSSSDSSVATVHPATGKVTILGAGTTTISASQQASEKYIQGSVTANLRVSKGAPRLGAFAISSRRFGDDAFIVKAPTSTSPSEIVFDSSDTKVAKISSAGKISIVGVGQTTISASQSENDDFESAERRVVLTIDKRVPSLSQIFASNHTFGEEPFVIAAPTSNSSGAFTFSSSDTNVLTVDASSGRVSVVGAGTASIRIAQASTATDESISGSVTITIGKATPRYGNFSISRAEVGVAAFAPNAPLSTSNAPFVFSSSNTSVATVNASTGRITVVGPGTSTITASQAESTHFRAGSVTATLTVDPGTPTLGNLIVADHIYGDSPFMVAAPSSNSNGAFTFSSSNTAVATVNSSSGQVTIVGVGTTMIRATQEATSLHTSSSVSTSLTVARGVPVHGAFTVATRLSDAAPFTITAPSSNSSGAFTFTSSNAAVATVNASTGQVTIVGVGTTSITAAQAETTYFASRSTSASFVVTQAVQAVVGCGSAAPGSCQVVTFTNVGSSTWTVPAGVTSVEYLVVAGGGGGASGGGGAGGVLTNVDGAGYSVTSGASIAVTVGDGGAAGNGNIAGTNGQNSSFGNIVAIGGGGGGGSGSAVNGGSGGGSGYDKTSATRTTGTAGQGFGGGRSGFGGYGAGGGGGGAGGAGSDTTVTYVGGAGGIGIRSGISGTDTYYGGGGGGGVNNNSGSATPNGGGLGGMGGGGNGSTLGYNGGGAFFDGTSGAANTGGGGGGTDPGSSLAGSGGSGIVIIRYSLPFVTAQIMEGQSTTLTAPAGMRFSSVLFASYGTPTVSGSNYSVSNCHASTSTSVVTSRAVGQNSFSISADNGLFGDPCGGTYKWLSVKIAYAP